MNEKLKKLLEDNNDKVVDYGIDVAKNILNKGIPYNKLSPKQQWRVEMILIIVVLISLVLIFKSKLTSLVNTIFSKINTEAGKV